VVAAGADAVANGADAVANGADAVANGADAVANGADAVANGADAVANGADAVANGADAVANGADAVANGADANGTCRADGATDASLGRKPQEAPAPPPQGLKARSNALSGLARQRPAPTNEPCRSAPNPVLPGRLLP